MSSFSRFELLSSIDQTLLKTDVGRNAYKKWIKENAEVGFKTLCVPPYIAKETVEYLRKVGSGTKCCTVIGFPNGYTTANTKKFEAIEMATNGVSEIDIVMNISLLKDGQYNKLWRDLQNIIIGFHEAEQNELGDVKVIIETCYLTPEEIKAASEIIVESGADFVKTSTGFGPRGASIEDIQIIKSVVPNNFGIKASGGISTLSFVNELMDAGATRIGTSQGQKIISELDN